MSWTEREISQLKSHLAKGTLFQHEIAKLMKRKTGSVAYMARKLEIPFQRPDGRYGEWNRKHSHLRKAVLTYFLTHSFDETAEKYSLTASQLKSLFTLGYKDPDLAHLRKDSRRKDEWGLEEMLFLLKYSGVQSRQWIAKSLDRSSARNIKERMQKWNASTKWLNGMPLAWAITLWPEAKPPSFKTAAGPGVFKYRIVTWHDAAILAEKCKTPQEVRACIRAMVRFTEFIHQTNSKSAIKRRFTKALSKEVRGGTDSKAGTK